MYNFTYTLISLRLRGEGCLAKKLPNRERDQDVKLR